MTSVSEIKKYFSRLLRQKETYGFTNAVLTDNEIVTVEEHLKKYPAYAIIKDCEKMKPKENRGLLPECFEPLEYHYFLSKDRRKPNQVFIYVVFDNFVNKSRFLHSLREHRFDNKTVWIKDDEEYGL